MKAVFMSWLSLISLCKSRIKSLCLMMLLLACYNSLQAQVERDYDEEEFIQDFDSIVPLFSVNSALMENTLDSLCFLYRDLDANQKQWDLRITHDSISQKTKLYFTKSFFRSIHKIGYGVLKYNDFTFVISGDLFDGLKETPNVVSMCFCASYPIHTWDPPSILFVCDKNSIDYVYARTYK